MANYFNTLSLREQLTQLGKCRFMESSEFSDGVEALKGKKIVIVGCGAQGLNQGLNMRDSGLDISYTDSGIPILPNVETFFTCKTFSKHEAGDHVILIGEVIDYQDSIAQPLTFFRGKFLPGPHA